MPKQKSKPAPKPDPKPLLSLGTLPPRWQWLTDNRFLVSLGLYIILLYLFRENVFNGMGPRVTPDRAASMSLKLIATQWLSNGIFPFWNPYFYCGMPMFESFQSSWLFYPFHWIFEGLFRHPDYPGFYNGGLGNILLFGAPPHVRTVTLHYLLGAIGTAFLVRHLGGKGWAMFAAGLLFLLSPQLVVLGDVGHGSKLYAMCWIPWVLLALDRAFEWPNTGRIATLAAAFAMIMTTQHIQVAYYAYMLAGLWWIVRQGINVYDRNFKQIPRDTGVFAIGGFVGVLATSLIYLNTLTYSQDTIRGAEGVTWEYATNWSFHPKESLSMFIPDFFGFGGQTYWGYLPFTDMPMYWGIPALVLAVIALITVKSWKVRTLFAAGFLAWIASFGKFSPILYKPFYDFLPFFNKFRVPMMIHIIVLLGAIVLAGIGLQKILDIRKEDDKTWKKWSKILNILFIISGALLVLVFLLKGTISLNVADWVTEIKPAIASASGMLAERAADSVVRSMLLIFITIIVLRLSIVKNVPVVLPGLIISVLILVDLTPLAERLIHSAPVSTIGRYFRGDDATKFLKDAPRGRLLPIDTHRPTNTWATFGLELQGGYTGSKPAYYGYLQEKNALTYGNILAVTDVKYVHSTKPVQGLQPLYQGKSGFVYSNPEVLPRAYLRSSWETIPDMKTALDRLMSQGFNPKTDLILDRDPATDLVKTDSSPGTVSIESWNPNEVVLKADCKFPAVLVLGDSYTSSGWKATVNGEKTEIVRANGIFRAIAIPKGKSEITFTYRPAHWTLSLIITLAAWLFIIVLWLIEIMASRRLIAEGSKNKNVINLETPKASGIHDNK